MQRTSAGIVAVVLLVAAAIRMRSFQVTDADSVVFVGAGDIANCGNLGPARATARLLDRIDGAVFTLGDHAYPHGSKREYRDCYDPTWGRHKARTHPTIGNHDLLADDGRTYFEYFGDSAGPKGRGYYSFDLGAWHILSLNSNAPAGNRSSQVTWLHDDLTAHPTDCVLAYWHVAMFSSGPHGMDSTMREVWRVLYEAGADVVLSAHDHGYERFAPQDDRGKVDLVRGIREFVVGTGGGERDRLGKLASNSEVHDNNTFGVLKLTLSPGKYAWEFIPVPGQQFHDSGTGACSPAK